jgi:hypothetical protein
MRHSSIAIIGLTTLVCGLGSLSFAAGVLNSL